MRDICVEIKIDAMTEGMFKATSEDIPELRVYGPNVSKTLEMAMNSASNIIAAYQEREDETLLNSILFPCSGGKFQIPVNLKLPPEFDIEKNRLIPLNQWFCDSCGKVIQHPEEGWFEWYSDITTEKYTGFRIVHHNGECQYNGRTLYNENKIIKDVYLTEILGSTGLGYLLDLLDESSEGYRKTVDLTELIEIIKRVSIPYWEEARFYWQKAINSGVSPIYSSERLIAIIKEYGEIT